MALTRRQALKTAGAAVAAAGIAKPAIAQKSPIQVGYLPAITGPSSSTGVGISRGTELAVQEIKLFVKRKPGAALDAAGLSTWLGERLAPYQNPRYIVMVDDFERTASQRIMKHRLTAHPAGTWDRTANR